MLRCVKRKRWQQVDAVVKGEAETIWPTVLADAQRGALGRLYEGGLVDLESVPPARHDLLPMVMPLVRSRPRAVAR